MSFQTPAPHARAAVIALGAVTVAATLSAWADYIHAQGYQKLIRGEVIGLNEAEHLDRMREAANVAVLLCQLLAAVVFILWFRRCYLNLPPEERRYGTPWTVWGWFIPVVSLWRPKQLADDLVNSRSGAGVSSALVLSWWILFLIAAWVDNLAVFGVFGGGSLAALRHADIASGVSNAVTIAAAVLAILVIRQITDGQLRTTTRDPQTEAIPIYH
jgi:Domain of unknown function (DUF4328)